MAKVIKLTDNNNVTLLPITDAKYVQMSVDGENKSVQEVILENEEVTAAGYSELDNRLESLENIDFSNFSTERVHVVAGREILSGTTVVSLGTVPAGAHFLHVEGTGSSANYGISVVWGSDRYEFNSSSDGTLHGDAHYEAESHTQSATAVVTVSGTPAADTRIVVIIYDKTNELVSYVGQVAITNDYNDLNNKPTIPSLSKGTTSGSGNAVTDISVSGHTITLTKGSTFLTSTSQSKDFGKVTTANNISTYTAPATSAASAIADAVKDELKLTGANAWIRLGTTTTAAEGTADADNITIGHVLANNDVTTNANGGTLSHGGTLKTVSYVFDAAGHRSGTMITTYTLPANPTISYINAIGTTGGGSGKYVSGATLGNTSGGGKTLTLTYASLPTVGVSATGTGHYVGYIKGNSNHTVTYYMTDIDADYVNITYDGVTKSVKDAIIENEEITAIALNDLNTRILGLESDIENTSSTEITANTATSGYKVFSYTSNGVSKDVYTPIASTSSLGVVKTSYTATNGNYPVKVDSSGNMYTKIDLASIDGVNVGTIQNIVHYGECTTTASTAAKTVSISSFKLVTGSRCVVKFSETNTAATPKLNVNSTGEKSIYWHGVQVQYQTIVGGHYYHFVYDGTNYQIVGSSFHSVPYGAVGVAGDVAAKTVTAPGFHLCTGAVINVRFTFRNTADSPTLNVNSLGAKSIFYNGSAIGSTDAKYLLHEQIALVYDGVEFNISSANAKKSIELEVYDDRSVSDAPYAYAKSITAHFKSNGTNGLSKGYSTMLEISGWTGASGGPSHELAFAQTNGEIWHRYSSNETTWNAWSQVLESSNVNLTSSASGTSNTVTLSYGASTKSVTLEHYTPSTASTVVGPPAGTPATKTLAHSGNFAVPRISFDSKGHIVLGETITYTLPDSGNTDTKVSFTSTTTDAKYPLIFKYTADNGTGANAVRFDSEIGMAYYNPGKNYLWTYLAYHDTMYTKRNDNTYCPIPVYDVVVSSMSDLSLF